MKRQNNLSNQDIEKYLDILSQSFGLYPMVNETSLKIQFEYQLYTEVVYEMLRRMGLPVRIKIICYSDEKYPDKEAFARILIPVDIPRIGTESFKSLRIHLEIRACLKNNFDKFVTVIAHELSHLILHGTDHQLKDSEEATDLCSILFGFGHFLEKANGRVLFIGTMQFQEHLGYLSDEQRDHAIAYIEKLRGNR